MRISGGSARGIPLQVPKGDVVRPATDGLRQSVFSSLAARIQGARFLDLFAGSGAYGLEAYSRGAAGGVFVEKNGRAIACLRANVAAVCRSAGRPEAELTVAEAEVTSALARLDWSPDLVFADPPYELIPEAGPAVFAGLARWVPEGSGTIVVFEMPGEVNLDPPGWECAKRLGRGGRQPTAAIFRRK